MHAAHACTARVLAESKRKVKASQQDDDAEMTGLLCTDSVARLFLNSLEICTALVIADAAADEADEESAAGMLSKVVPRAFQQQAIKASVLLH